MYFLSIQPLNLSSYPHLIPTYPRPSRFPREDGAPTCSVPASLQSFTTGEQDDRCLLQEDEEAAVSWRVLTAPQRESFLCRGFAVVDSLAPPALTAAAYREATARASSGELKPAHGRCLGDTRRDVGGEDDPAVYLRSVPDDLTLLLSAENEVGEASIGIEEAVANERQVEGKVTDGPAAGGSAIARMLQVLVVLGEDLKRIVRLRGRVEHQVCPGRAELCTLASFPSRHAYVRPCGKTIVRPSSSCMKNIFGEFR